MFSKLQGRFALAGFRWSKIRKDTKAGFIGTLVLLAIIGFVIPVPDTFRPFFAWLLGCLFLLFFLLMSISSYLRQMRLINRLHKADLNGIRRKYGLKEH